MASLSRSLTEQTDIFDDTLLKNPRLAGVTDVAARLQILVDSLFNETFRRASRALLERDHLVLAVSLARIKLRGEDEAELDALLDVSGGGLDSVGGLASFAGVADWTRSDDGQAWLDAAEPETTTPTELWADAPATSQAIRTMLLVRALRPDRLLPAASAFASAVFGVDALSLTHYELVDVVRDQAGPRVPTILASTPGFDASHRLAALDGCKTVALGAPESVALAEAAIAQATRSGGTVALLNSHLAIDYLAALEKRLVNLSASSSFRLLLTSASDCGRAELRPSQWRRSRRSRARSCARAACS